MLPDLDALLGGEMSALVAALHAGDVDPVELAHAALVRTAHAPAAALVAVDEEVTLAQARRLAQRLEAGERPPLAGVPVAHKDLVDSVGMPTTSGNPALVRHPDRAATAVARSVEAGCVELGKANLHEVAFGVTGRNPHTGTPLNPAAPDRIPGGSSSGSAACVAAGTVMGSLGTDTGGSVRIPAACCGVVGLKVTRGAVPTTGVTPLSWLQDTVGPIARTCVDAGRLLGVVAGPDGADPVARTGPPSSWPVSEVHAEVDDLVLVLPPQLWEGRVDPQVREVARSAVRALERAGARVEERGLDGRDRAVRAQQTLLGTHAYTVHRRRFEEEPDVYGADTRERLAGARDIAHWEVTEALRERERWKATLDGVAPAGTLIASPTLAFPVPALDAEEIAWEDGSESITPALTRLTAIWNLAGNPALTVPCGTVAGAPVGLQLIGRWWSEPRLLAAGAAVEAAVSASLPRPADA